MQQISPIKKRIIQALDFQGVSRYKFYKESGMSRGVLDKPSGITEDNIAKFIAYMPNINFEWLLTGNGEILKGDKKETETNDNFKELAEARKKMVDFLEKDNSRLEKELKELKKAQEPRSTYRNVAEPDQ